jgi:hypothetical protein
MPMSTSVKKMRKKWQLMIFTTVQWSIFDCVKDDLDDQNLLLALYTTYDHYHDLLDSQSVYSGLGVDRKILCSHDSDV